MVDPGSDDAKKGTFKGFMGLNMSFLDTRVSDRAPNVWGQTGLMRVNSARAGKSGYFDFSLHGRAFYLSQELFPVSGGGPFVTDCARYSGVRDCDTYLQGYMQGFGSFGVTILDYLEMSLATVGTANENSEGKPRVIISTGNVAGSLKLSLPVVVWTAPLAEKFKTNKALSLLFPIPLAFGLDARVFLPSRTNALGSQLDNFAILPSALATLDLYEVRGWPFRAHLNLGYAFQSVWGVAGSVQNRRIEEGKDRWLTGAQGQLAAVALDYNYLDRVTYGMGAEVPLPFVTPFLEYTGEVPVPLPWKQAPTYTGNTLLGKEGNPLLNPLTWPSRLTPGVRITPGRGLAFDLSVDLTLGGRNAITNGLATQVPWAAWLGVSYAFSPFVAETQVEIREVEKRVEVIKQVATASATPGGKVSGRVVDDATGQPIPEPRLTLPNASGPRILGNPDGTFETYQLDPGAQDVTAEATDYDAGGVKAQVTPGQSTAVEIRLKANPRMATFKATIVNEKDEAVPSTLTLTDQKGRSYNVDAKDGQGQVAVPPGRYNAVAKADGYLLSGKNVIVEAGVKTAEVFLLKVEPKKRLTTLTKERIDIKSTIPFEYNKARLLSAASFILDEVVDTLLKNPQISKLRVEGHTDNTGAAEYNQKLSQARAEAVRDYLISNGVAPERVDANGFGDTRPVVANTSETGRAKNRRVEFVIVNQDGDATAPDAASGGK